MIAGLHGRVSSRAADHVVLDVHGVGYQVFTPDPGQLSPGSEQQLHTVLVVRDDSLSLYGFTSVGESELFRNLIRVSGIGPRLALAVLATMDADSLRQAVLGDRPELLTRVPGIGRKTAGRLIIELRDKLGDDLTTLPGVALSDTDAEVLDALVALGYSLVEAQTALQSLPADSPEPVEERVRLALQFFA